MNKSVIYAVIGGICLIAVFTGIFVTVLSDNSSAIKITSTVPKNAELTRMYDQSVALYKNRNYVKAQEIFNELISKFPNSPEAIKARSELIDLDNLAKKEKEAIAQEEKKKAIEAEQKKTRLSSAMEKMKKDTDEVQNITWYYDQSTSTNITDEGFYLYIGKQTSGNQQLRFRIQYTSDNWLFIKRFVVKADDKTYAIPLNYDDVKRDAHYGGISEWYDTSFAQHSQIIKAIIASEKTILRCEGEKFYNDRILTTQEKKAMQNVMDAYEAMGGSI